VRGHSQATISHVAVLGKGGDDVVRGEQEGKFYVPPLGGRREIRCQMSDV
jgi:hypothetical protein